MGVQGQMNNTGSKREHYGENNQDTIQLVIMTIPFLPFVRSKWETLNLDSLQNRVLGRTMIRKERFLSLGVQNSG